MAARHSISHAHSPKIWQEGLPLGNGEVGAMLWGNGNPLALTLDHAQIWDLRENRAYRENADYTYARLRQLVADKDWERVDEIFERRQRRENPINPTKISIGRMEITFPGAIDIECSLDIDRALVEGSVRTASGSQQPFTCFVHKDTNILCLKTPNTSNGLSVQMLPLDKLCPELAQLRFPEPLVDCQNDLCTYSQQIPDGVAYTLAWEVGEQGLLLAIEVADSVDISKVAALKGLQAARELGFDQLYTAHIGMWESFWSASSVHLPEKDTELLWYYGIYLLASSAKKGSIPPGLQGVWAMDGVVPPWRGDYHSDMNVQETFWPALSSDHLDLMDCWCDYMQRCIPEAQEFTRHFFGTGGTFWYCSTIPFYTLVAGWHTVNFAWSHTGWLGWMVWLRWRYSKDVNWLRDTGYPVFSQLFEFYRANLVEEDDGYLHIPLSSSPEYADNTPRAWCKDPNVDIALIRRCCAWIVEMEKALGENRYTDHAEHILSKLVPYSLNSDNVLCLWPGKVLDESHRHPSQLMAVHPAMDITIDGGEKENSIIDSSIDQYMQLGQQMWTGHTYTQMISMAAVAGRAELAYDFVLQYRSRWIAENGLFFNRDLTNSGQSIYSLAKEDIKSAPFTMEASNAFAAGVSDMLLQGWNDVLRIFPAVPDCWQDITFQNLLAEGAFKVSAARRNGKTLWVSVTAGVDSALKMKNPFAPGSEVEVSESNVVFVGGFYTAQMKAGQTLSWSADGFVFDRAAIPPHQPETSPSVLGLK